MNLNFVNHVRAIRLSRSETLLPILEAIVNSIDAIEEAGLPATEGHIQVRVIRRHPLFTDEESKSLAPIVAFEIEDNGVGFTTANFASFNEASSEKKLSSGGKGVGRFLWLKVFEQVHVSSVFIENGLSKQREFDFVLENNPVQNISDIPLPNGVHPRTKIYLNNAKEVFAKDFPARLETIAYRVIYHCLEYFVLKTMPTVVITDEVQTISLSDEYERWISINDRVRFQIDEYEFTVNHFLLNPQSHMGHTINFCARKRVVISKVLDSSSIPNLPKRIGSDHHSEQLVYMAYVSSKLLDEKVSRERTGFDLPQKGQVKFGGEVFWSDIESQSIAQASEFLKDITDEVGRSNYERIKQYVQNESPRYRYLLKYYPELVSNIEPNIADVRLEESLHRVLHEKMIELGETARQILEAGIDELTNPEEEINRKYDRFLEEWNELSHSALAEYIVQRRKTIAVLDKFIRLGENGKYALEEAIHRLIFPMRSTSDDVPYDRQNLWIIDEKLSFHEYLSSDKPLAETVVETDDTDRPDLLIFDRPIALADDKASNGITIL